MRQPAPTDPPLEPGALLRLAREEALVSARDLAALVGVSPSVVSRLENHAHLLRVLDQEAALAPEEWVLNLEFDAYPLRRLLVELPVLVDGTLAARLHGLPLPVGDVELVMAGGDAAHDALTRASTTTIARLQRADDDTWLVRGERRWFRIRVVGEAPPSSILPLPADLGEAATVIDLAHLQLGQHDARLFRHAMDRIGHGR